MPESPSFKNVSSQEISSTEKGSLDDLSKSLQCAEVDIHGIDRKSTLKRKMTVLAKDPTKNRLLLKQRMLKRQLKVMINWRLCSDL